MIWEFSLFIENKSLFNQLRNAFTSRPFFLSISCRHQVQHMMQTSTFMWYTRQVSKYLGCWENSWNESREWQCRIVCQLRISGFLMQVPLMRTTGLWDQPYCKTPSDFRVESNMCGDQQQMSEAVSSSVSQCWPCGSQITEEKKQKLLSKIWNVLSKFYCLSTRKCYRKRREKDKNAKKL